jgi:glycyl-tRNA synthetase beta chain
VTVAVSLADKLDTLISFFTIQERPSGSRDPFALRRAALGAIELILRNNLRLELDYVTARASSRLMGQFETGDAASDEAMLAEYNRVELYREVPDFFVERLKVQQREAGIRHDLIDAVFSLEKRKDDIVLNLARVKALQAFVSTEDGANLLAGYKRAANILRKEGWGEASGAVDSRLRGNDGGGAGGALSYQPEPAESALIAALDAAESAADTAVSAENFEGAMAALATLRGPIDAFFESVTVNDADPDKRAARLGLLARIRGAVHRVADFSKIEG